MFFYTRIIFVAAKLFNMLLSFRFDIGIITWWTSLSQRTGLFAVQFNEHIKYGLAENILFC